MVKNRAHDGSRDREYARQQVLMPPPNDTRIWRYMSFVKLVSLLQTRSLYFCRADRFPGDPFEGAFKHISPGAVNAPAHEQYRNEMRFLKRRTFVNCWHMAEKESSAMWQLYVPSAEGIVLESTYGRLRQSLKADVRIGTVRYIDYQNRGPDLGYYFSHFLFKRTSFAHERELRALVQDIPDIPSRELPSLPPCAEEGRLLRVSLERLVVTIRVSPSSSKSFIAKVAGEMQRYDLKREALRSDFAAEPVP